MCYADVLCYDLSYSGGRLVTACRKIRLPDDCTLGYIVCEYLAMRSKFVCTKYIIILLCVQAFLQKITLAAVNYGDK